jgi:hypothetical protein
MAESETEMVELSTKTLDDIEDLLTDPRSSMAFGRRLDIHEQIQRERK